MSQSSQPAFLSSWLSSFASFDTAHGWGVNLFVVVGLAAIGVLLLTGRRRLVLGGISAFVVLCLADWVLVQDLGFLGGLGTDPNSMVPMALLFVAGYLAMVRLPAGGDEPAADGRLPSTRRLPNRTQSGPARGGDERHCPTWHARWRPSPRWPSSSSVRHPWPWPQ